MHKIDGAGHQDGQFVSEDVASARAPTLVTPEWLNAVQGELVAVVEAAGLTLDKASSTQVAQAITVLINRLVAAHVASADPHSQYMTAAELGAAIPGNESLADHEAELDPHPQYMTAAEVGAAIAAASGGSTPVSTNVTASRSPDTIYPNTSGGTIEVIIVAYATASPFRAYRNNVLVGEVAGDNNNTGTITFDVPNGANYKYTNGSGGASLITEQTK
jgi:hypothetical protein